MCDTSSPADTAGVWPACRGGAFECAELAFLVNNAGIVDSELCGPAAEKLNTWRRLIDVNPTGAQLFLGLAAVPPLHAALSPPPAALSPQFSCVPAGAFLKSESLIPSNSKHLGGCRSRGLPCILQCV